MFQSTLPAKGATSGETAHDEGSKVSIHAPCEGSDRNILCITKRETQYIVSTNIAAARIVPILAVLALVKVHFACEPPRIFLCT